jgi:GAF domain-containing protein
VAEGKLTGLLEFTGTEPVVLSSARLRALRALADQIAAALRSQSLLGAANATIDELRRRVRVLETLNLLATRVSADADEPVVLAESIRSVAQSLDVERGAIVLFQPGVGAAVAAAYPATNMAGAAMSMDALPFVSALSQGPVIVEDATPRTDRTQQYVTALGMRAALFQPLMVQGSLAGLLALGYQRPRAFAPEAVEQAGAMAAQLGAGIQTMRLRQTSQDAVLQEQRVDEIVTTYQSLNTVDDLLRITLTELSKTLGARHAAIRLAVTQNTENGHA